MISKRTILASATDDGYLPVNPARIRGAGQAKRGHKVRPATLSELQTLTEAMPPPYRLMVQLAPGRHRRSAFLPPCGVAEQPGVSLPDQREAIGWDVRTDATTS